MQFKNEGALNSLLDIWMTQTERTGTEMIQLRYWHQLLVVVVQCQLLKLQTDYSSEVDVVFLLAVFNLTHFLFDKQEAKAVAFDTTYTVNAHE